MKPSLFFSVIAALAVCTASVDGAVPVVANLMAAQRTGTKLVDIHYDVTADVSPVTVALEISADGGATWAAPATTVTGDIGAGVATGTGKTLTWNAGADWNEQAASQMKFRVTVYDLVGQPADFALIPAGAFQMGDASSPQVGNSDELPVHGVSVSGIYMAKYLVTKATWDAVKTWGTTNGYTDLPGGSSIDQAMMGTTTLAAVSYSKGTDHPVHLINWYAVAKWCNARSQQEGLTPCYYLNSGQTTADIYKTGNINIGNSMVNWSASGYRLPTEAEWEKAARGGQSGQNFPWGSTITQSQANYCVPTGSSSFSYDASSTRGFQSTYISGNYPYTSPVGSFAPSGYGLYDMGGNVWEWCWDWYSSGYYASSPAGDPRGASAGSQRVFRGGSWSDFANRCRIACRDCYNPASSYLGHGFRVVRNTSATGIATTANVAVDTHSVTLTLTPPAPGQGSVSGAGSYAKNATATVTAVPAAGYVLAAWTGDASGTANPLSVVMTANKTIGATFGPDPAATDNSVGLVIYVMDSTTPGTVGLRFNAALGVSYSIEASTNLFNWSALESDIIGQGGVVTRSYSTATQVNRFFRVRRN